MATLSRLWALLPRAAACERTAGVLVLPVVVGTGECSAYSVLGLLLLPSPVCVSVCECVCVCACVCVCVRVRESRVRV